MFNTTRRRRLTKVAGLVAASGALLAGLSAFASPAEASTVGPGPANCVLPAGVTWQYVGSTFRFIGPTRYLLATRWQAASGAVIYNGRSIYVYAAPDKALAAGYTATCSTTTP